MSSSTLLTPAEVVLSRRALSGPDDGQGAADRARRVVRSATTVLELIVENAERGRTVDGWLADDGLVWHLRGDLDTPRTAVVVPPPHLGPVVAAMVALGERRTPDATEVQVEIARLRDQLAGGDRTGLPGGVQRVWSLGWTGGHAGRISVVDQGPNGGLWLVSASHGDTVTLRPVPPLKLWTRLCKVPALAHEERPAG